MNMLQIKKLLKIFQGEQKRDDSLKIIGIMAMIIDHIGIVFFPQVSILRIIGRLVFPIFAFGIVIGYKHTSNVDKYFWRIFWFGVLSQIPFMLSIGSYDLNIMFSLSLGLLFIHFWDTKRYWFMLTIIGIIYFVPIEYNYYGLVTIFIFYIFQNNKIANIYLQLINSLLYFVFHFSFIQFYALGGVIISLYLPQKDNRISLNKYFFYWFYPTHLFILFLIKYLIAL